MPPASSSAPRATIRKRPYRARSARRKPKPPPSRRKLKRRAKVAAPICVARIGTAHGVRGAVKLWTFTEDPLAIKRYGPLVTKDGARQFEVATAREAKGHLVATLKGIATREEAERLNGLELYVAREALPATDEDEYYHADLIGLAAVTTANEPLGRVVAIHNFCAGDIIE